MKIMKNPVLLLGCLFLILPIERVLSQQPDNAAVTRIESMIVSGKNSEAESAASELEKKGATAGSIKEQADAAYCLGLIAFLSGNNDQKADQELRKAMAFYEKSSTADNVGGWKCLYVMVKLYFDHRKQDPNAWTAIAKTLSQVESLARKQLLGASQGANGPAIYSAMLSNPELMALDKVMHERLDQIKQQGNGGAELIDQQQEWEKGRDRDLELTGFGRNMNLPRSTYFSEGMQKISQARDETTTRLKTSLTNRINVLSKMIDESHLHSDATASNTIEGHDSEGFRWAYEFLSDQGRGKPSLLDSTTATVVFQSPEWIVEASEEAGNVGNMKTDLCFYDARTLNLIATARIPNKVISVGRVGNGSSFYAVTITPSKYRYDDAPLALCLIDPKAKQIDRVRLVKENYWLALNNPIHIEASGNTVNVLVNPNPSNSEGKEGGYSVSTISNPYFKNISISLQPGAADYYRRNPIKELFPRGYSKGEALIPSEKDFDQQARNESASLRALGIKPSGNLDQRDVGAKAGAALLSNNPLSGVHIVSADQNGTIQDINLDSLTAKSLKLSSSRIESPGIFSDGCIHGVNSGNLVLAKGTTNLTIPFTKAMVLFNESAAYAIPQVPEQVWWMRRVVSDPEHLSLTSITSAGKTNQVQVPGNHSRKDGEIAIYPEQNIFYSYRNEDGTNVFTKYSMKNGSQIDEPIRTETGKSGTVSCIREGICATGHRLVCVVTDFSTQGAGYSIFARCGASKPLVELVRGLSELADPLAMRPKGDGTIQLLYSCAGVTKVEEHAPDGKLKETLAEWPSPPQEGKPLLLSERNLVFIPKAGGYDAYRIFGEGKPEKAFEIYFRGSSDYVILLPNGFYAGSPGCERLITLQAGDGKVDASALAPWRNRPAEVIKALGGDPKNADILAKVTERWLKRAKFDPSQPEPKASEIPKVDVNQMPPLWAQGAGITFPIEVTAGASSLKEVTVRVNGIPQQAISGSALKIPVGGKGTVQGSVTLAQGQNWIEVTATDEKGRVSNQAHFRSILSEATEKPKRYIVAMGCSVYDRPELKLEFAAKDAGDVLKTFSEAGGRDCKTLLLTNNDVSPEALEKIKAFVGESKESDEVILFCAGHGLLDEHLDYVYAGHQIDPEHPGDTGIHLDALLDAIKAGKSLKRLVLMDTCQSGSVGEKEEMKLASASTELPHGVRAVKSRALKVVGVSPMTGGDQQRFIEEMFLLPGQHRGINIIGASGGAEYAMESDKWNNGVFTSALIEALRDQKADMDHRGRISVSDLKTYLGQRVSELTGGAQKPSVVAFEQDQDFDLLGDMPPIPESVKKQGVATTSEAPLPVTPLSVASESSSMTPPNLGAQFVNSLGQKFVPIPGTPAYFCIWDTRVSDYGQFVKETGRAWKPAGFPQKPDHPAVRINYNDATAFCDWLTKSEHVTGKLPSNVEYRLPKDLEWSAAAGITDKEMDGPPAWRSGGIPNCYAWGSSWPPPKGSGNYDPKMKTDSFPNTSPVGSFAPNRFGLFDMNGNAYQWTLEDYDESGQGSQRGGSWADEEEESISLSNRFTTPKDSQGKCYGFRCVIAPIDQNK